MENTVQWLANTARWTVQRCQESNRKGGITIDCVNNITANNSNVVLGARGPQHGCNLIRLACNPGVIFVTCNLDFNTNP